MSIFFRIIIVSLLFSAASNQARADINCYGGPGGGGGDARKKSIGGGGGVGGGCTIYVAPPATSANKGPTYTLARVDHPDGYPLNVRSNPYFNYNIIGTLPSDASGIKVYSCQAVENDDETRRWCLIHYKELQGWVSAKYLSVDRLFQSRAD
jgi:uncharacterized protein YraI